MAWHGSLANCSPTSQAPAAARLPVPVDVHDRARPEPPAAATYRPASELVGQPERGPTTAVPEHIPGRCRIAGDPDELHEAGYSSLQDVYFRQAFIDAGIDPNSWDPSKGLKANDANVQAVRVLPVVMGREP